MIQKSPLITGTASGGLVGVAMGMLTDENFRSGLLEWFKTELGPMGFVMLVFNLVTALSLYLIFGFFADRDDEKRDDTKEAFGLMRDLVADMKHTIKENTQALAVIRALFLKEGNNAPKVNPDHVSTSGHSEIFISGASKASE